MIEGVLQTEADKQIAQFLKGDAFADVNATPLSAVLSGSKAYGLGGPESDRDYLGIHIMSTWEVLEHPDYRSNLQVIRKKYDSSLKEIPLGIKGGDLSLDSFELWKFVTMYLKGSFVIYELLHMPTVHHDPSIDPILSLMRSGLTNKLGRVAKGNCMHDWRKERQNRKKTVMAYYRLAQALHFLREGVFKWQAKELFDYLSPRLFTAGRLVVDGYMIPELRTTKVSDAESDMVSNELDLLINEVDRSMITTKLPDKVPRKTLDEILKRIKHGRSQLI